MLAGNLLRTSRQCCLMEEAGSDVQSHCSSDPSREDSYSYQGAIVLELCYVMLQQQVDVWVLVHWSWVEGLSQAYRG